MFRRTVRTKQLAGGYSLFGVVTCDVPSVPEVFLVVLEPKEKRGERVSVSRKDIVERGEKEIRVPTQLEKEIPRLRTKRVKAVKEAASGRRKKKKKEKKKRPKSDKEKKEELLSQLSPDQLAQLREKLDLE